MIKSLFIAGLCFIVIMILIDQITKYLDGKPKKHKFRQWWNKHICDLDNLYN